MPDDSSPTAKWHPRQIRGPVHQWQVQEAGEGETILLLHGAGGSIHSMRGLFMDLVRTHHVIALDLPGHGETRLGARHRSGLAHMTTDIAQLLEAQGWHPVAIVGHSAGGAVALNLAQELTSPRGGQPMAIGINAALQEFDGMAGILFPVLAKALALMPFAASLFSGAARNPERVRNMIASTGSTVSPESIAEYRRLIGKPAHVDGTLLMMAQWDLRPLLAALPEMSVKTVLIAATNDRTVPAGVSAQAVKRMREAIFVELEGLGHLAHEERPEQIAEIIRDVLI